MKIIYYVEFNKSIKQYKVCPLDNSQLEYNPELLSVIDSAGFLAIYVKAKSPVGALAKAIQLFSNYNKKLISNNFKTTQKPDSSSVAATVFVLMQHLNMTYSEACQAIQSGVADKLVTLIYDSLAKDCIGDN
jgi:hypothetical protein